MWSIYQKEIDGKNCIGWEGEYKGKTYGTYCELPENATEKEIEARKSVLNQNAKQTFEMLEHENY